MRGRAVEMKRRNESQIDDDTRHTGLLGLTVPNAQRNLDRADHVSYSQNVVCGVY